MNDNRVWANHSRQLSNDRTASVILCVLIVLLIVGMLGMQTLQTLGVIRRSSIERAKIRQAREVAEIARQIDWTKLESAEPKISELKIDIPTELDAEPRQATAIVRREATDSASSPRIIVRYPAGEAGELTTTLEIRDENKTE